MATKNSTAKKSPAKKSPAKKSTSKSPGPRKSAARATRQSSTLTIITEGLPPFRVGRTKKTRIKADGGTPPYTFSRAQGSLPAGLSLNSQGTLWGTPGPTANSMVIWVKVTDQMGGHNTQAFSLQIDPA